MQLGFLNTVDPVIPTLPLGWPGPIRDPNISYTATAGQVTKDVAGALTGTTTANTFTWTSAFTIAAGSNLALYVFIGINAGTNRTITGMTWNGVAMTQVGARVGPFGDQGLYCFRLVNPDTGTQNLALTTNGSGTQQDFAVCYVALQNVDQTTPESATASDNDQTTNPVLTASPTGVLNGYPMCSVSSWDNDGSQSWTSAGGQTRIATGTGGTFSSMLDTMDAVNGPQNFSVTCNINAAYDADMLAVVAYPAAGSPVSMPVVDYTRLSFLHMMMR